MKIILSGVQSRTNHPLSSSSLLSNTVGYCWHWYRDTELSPNQAGMCELCFQVQIHSEQKLASYVNPFYPTVTPHQDIPGCIRRDNWHPRHCERWTTWSSAENVMGNDEFQTERQDLTCSVCLGVLLRDMAKRTTALMWFKSTLPDPCENRVTFKEKIRHCSITKLNPE